MNEPDPAGLHTLVTKSDAPIHRATYVTTEAAASEAMIAIARHMIAESFSKLSHAEKVVFFVIVAHARFSHQYTGLVCMEEPDTLWARAAVRRGGWHPAVNRLEELGFIRRIKRGGCLHDHYEIVVPPDPNEQPFVSDSIIEIGSLRPAGRDATRALPSRWTGRKPIC